MTIDPKRVKEIFLAATELPNQTTRAAFLDQACGADSGLRDRVEILLRSHDPEGSFLGTPAGVIPDPELAATRTFSADPEQADTRTSGGSRPDDEIPLGFLAPATRPDSLGRIGHYEVLQVLGQGGFGIVFRAFDDTLQRVVAVKVLVPQLAATSPARKRFLREARTSAAVRHENVVQVYEVGEIPLPYIAMEFIPGETLQQRLDRIGPIEPLEVVRIGQQIAEGLAAAHATDLIHRDIKPANILIEGGAQKVKITDFGLARAADDASISQSGIIAGTPMYMAPEQAKGDKLDQRADLFSLGSVLYQMASGRSPFRANGTLAVLKRVAEDTPRDIREIIPETPQWLCDIIAKLHAKLPDERFQSAREVADVLANCEGQLKAGSKLKDFSRIPRGKSQTSRRRKWVAAATVLLLPVIALAVTEFAGGTHLFWKQAAHDPIKSGDAPQAKVGAGWSGWPSDAPKRAIAPFDIPSAKGYQEAWAKYLGVPVEYMNSIGMKMRLIPPGEFTMGTSEEELDALLARFKELQWAHPFFRSEAPQRQVTIGEPLRLGACEVTVGQFRQFVKETAYQTEAEADGKGGQAPDGKGGWESKPLYTWKNEHFSPSENHPVAFVSPKDAKEFCRWLTKKEGRTYALASEEQWEFACRAGTVTRWFSGDDPDGILPFAWFGSQTLPVGSMQPNPFGLHDMIGNSEEFAIDRAGGPVSKGGGISGWPWGGRSSTRAILGDGPGMFRYGFRVAIVGDLMLPPSKQEPLPPPVAVDPLSDSDVQRIALLPAAEQVEEVRKELMRRNSGFDGTVEHKIEDGVVREFRVVTDKVTDISPIRIFNALRLLDCSGTHVNYARGNGQLADLTSLKGMNFTNLIHLDLNWTRVGNADLIHFRDCKRLIYLGLGNTKVGNTGLANFKNCKDLLTLGLSATEVSGAGLVHFEDCKNLQFLALDQTLVSGSGLVHFKGCKNLTFLSLHHTPVDDLDLGHFKNCEKLTTLHLFDTRVGDAGLAHFEGKPLKALHIHNTAITDLTPLQGMPLEDMSLTPKNITKGLDILRGLKSLKTLGTQYNQARPAAEFWDRFDKKEFGLAPLTEADVKRIAALPAVEQVMEVGKELMRRNHGFDGILALKIEEGGSESANLMGLTASFLRHSRHDIHVIQSEPQ